MCLLMMGSECGEDSTFYLVRGPENLVLGYFQADGAVSPKLLLKVEYTSSIVRLKELEFSV